MIAINFWRISGGNVWRDDALYLWVVGRFAEIAQRPDRKSGTALVIRGKQGTGKTIVGKVTGSLFREHCVLVADLRFIVGRFRFVSCELSAVSYR